MEEQQQHLDRLVHELKSRQQQQSRSNSQQHGLTILITGANRYVAIVLYFENARWNNKLNAFLSSSGCLE